MNLKKYRKFLDSKVTEYNYIKKEVTLLKQRIKTQEIDILKKQRALTFVQEVAIKTQEQLQIHINSMVSAGLNTVFDQKYEFVLQFVIRREKPECDLFFKKHDQLIDPLLFSGLGAADISAFCLRCSSWGMARVYRNTLLLDEPFKHLKGEKENKRAIQLMSTLSKKLNLQIICINDERIPREDIIEFSDKVFEIKQNNKGISKVKEIK